MKSKEPIDSGKINNNNESWWRPAMVMFVKFSAWIIFPALAGSGIGMWLDKKYNSEPWLLLISVGIAFIFSIIALIINALKEFKRLERQGRKIDEINKQKQ